MATTLKHAGYQTTETAVAWASGTTLASLANNGYTSLTDEIDNNSGGSGSPGYYAVDLRLVLASAAFTGGGSAIEVYLVATVDGTNYPTWGTGTSDLQANQAKYVGQFVLTGTTAAQAEVLLNIAVPAGKYKWAFRNKGGVALAASGNTIYWRPWSLQMV